MAEPAAAIPQYAQKCPRSFHTQTAINASMGTGIVDESMIATAPMPRIPHFKIMGRITSFHLSQSD